MERSPEPNAPRRVAHRRVGAASIASFLALLGLGAVQGPASASSPTPTVLPAAATDTQPAAPALPTDPRPGDPDGDGDGGFDHDGRGPDDGFRGIPGTGDPTAPDSGAPLPSTTGTDQS